MPLAINCDTRQCGSPSVERYQTPPISWSKEMRYEYLNGGLCKGP